ncbi:MAG TPA: AarF/UbiB family protein, partial [Anaerolineales bacterium]
MTLARHGLGWLVVQIGLGGLVPFQRGLLGHPPREEPYAKPEHIRMAFEELGATFIKLGQALSTRPDLLPDDYIDQLSRLQDAAPPVPHEQICKIVQDEFGQGPESLFVEFDPHPLASASIGQVHAAVLPTGQKVIVKVQRPGVAEKIKRDLEVLISIASWADANTAFGRQYNLTALVEEFAYTLQNELDYRREAHNADRFRRSFTGDEGVYIPKVFWEFTTDRILTLERVEGIKISEVEKLDGAGINRRKLAENAVRLMLREVFEFCFFHADPHPGNFFVRPDGSIALIDFGMVGSLDEPLQRTLLRIGLAVTRQDSGRLADEFYALGVAESHVRLRQQSLVNADQCGFKRPGAD